MEDSRDSVPGAQEALHPLTAYLFGIYLSHKVTQSPHGAGGMVPAPGLLRCTQHILVWAAEVTPEPMWLPWKAGEGGVGLPRPPGGPGGTLRLLLGSKQG